MEKSSQPNILHSTTENDRSVAPDKESTLIFQGIKQLQHKNTNESLRLSTITESAEISDAYIYFTSIGTSHKH